MSRLSEILRERGYVYQHSTETLEEITDGDVRTLYLGVDPTADSFHVGHLQALLVMRRFIEAGHKVILLIGGGTGMIGDPSGKSEERNLLDTDTVARNGEALKVQAEAIFQGKEIVLRNNANWLTSLNLVEFLRDIGKHFTVNSMVKREMVKERLEAESAISYTEFAYSILQAYDFLHLHKTEGCDLQIGASDQWGNIMSGVDLVRKKEGASVYGFTFPLLVNKATGKKFGKSVAGAIWLDPEKTSPFQFYQFWLQTEDDALEEYFLKMTLLPREEIDRILEEQRRDPSGRHGQRTLAWEVTSLVHGGIATQLQRVSDVLFGEQDFTQLTEDDLGIASRVAPSSLVHIGTSILDALVAAGLASSKREARQFIKDGAISLNGKDVTDETRAITEADLSGKVALLRRGKRHMALLVPDST
jgi:tyrosyl-tRNA synthetase